MRQEVRSYTQGLKRDNNHPTTATTAGEDGSTTTSTNSRFRRRPLKLVGILAPAGPLQQQRDTEFYSQRIAAACKDDGIHYELIQCKGTHPDYILHSIHQANQDDTVHGILVFYPIFKQQQEQHFVRPPQYDYFSMTTTANSSGRRNSSCSNTLQ
jgi:5,10-methylene-tetrahydrofolate dehydrogenase/methenyl tetrahydrofolate cyclohydrolase